MTKFERPMHNAQLDKQVLAELKGLVMDATRKANSGHPGGPMSAADFTTILYREFLRFSPKNPKWHNRDRFVLSGGHMSMLLYSVLHFADLLPLEEIINFRQWGSVTPGHPENHLTPGVEATTGPLGQGIAMAVGMAIAAKHQECVFGEEYISNKIYVVAGDGDFQEPIAIGASTLAGHLGLENLVVFYDKNDIQISGNTQRADSTHWQGLFEAIQWEVISIDGHNHTQIREVLSYAKTPRTKPLLIIGQTVMAQGTANMEGSHKAHGEPFKNEEIAASKLRLGLDPAKQFQVSESTYAYFQENLIAYDLEAENWYKKIEVLRKNDPDFDKKYASYFENIVVPTLPVIDLNKPIASRATFGQVLKAWGEQLPRLMGGSADLEPSNNTSAFAAIVGEYGKNNRSGRNLAFGVREFPMAAIQNGMALYGGCLPFGATFLTFADYSRNAIRMSALQGLQVLHVFTHDSFYLGEDGPTHQPIEHVMSLRCIPNLLVLRPADAAETAWCMQQFLQEQHRPAALCLTRQALPSLVSALEQANEAIKGGYICFRTAQNADVVIFASGSEVGLAVESAKILSQWYGVHVVSLPCWEWFFEQSPSYIEQVMYRNSTAFKVSIEAGVTLGWERFAYGKNSLNIGINHFGASAPADVLAEQYGFTPEKISNRIREAILNQNV